MPIKTCLPCPVGSRVVVGQGLTKLAEGAGGVVWTFLLSSILSSVSISLGDGPIWTEILSQRADKPKTTNQPTNLPCPKDLPEFPEIPHH